MFQLIYEGVSLSKEGELKKRLGLFDATAINVGAIIGGGIFVVTGIVAGLAGSALVVSMVLAAVTSLFTALSYAELVAWLPEEGSIYEYGYRLLSPAAGFLGGWMWIISNIFSGAAVALGFGNYLSALVPGLSPGIVAAAACVAFTALNYLGIQHSAELNNLLVVAKLIILGFFVAFGLLFVNVGNFQPFNPVSTGVLYGAFYIFFAYGGFARVAVVAEEIKDAKRVVPRAIMLSLIISTLFYIAVGLVAVGLVGAGSLSGSGHPLALAMEVTGNQTRRAADLHRGHHIDSQCPPDEHPRRIQTRLRHVKAGRLPIISQQTPPALRHPQRLCDCLRGDHDVPRPLRGPRQRGRHQHVRDALLLWRRQLRSD